MAERNDTTNTSEITIVGSGSAEVENKYIKQTHVNVKSDLIEITDDKLENILLKHLDKLGTRRHWLLPFSLLVTVSLALSTADFKTAFNVKPEVWKAIFILVVVVSVIWLIRDLYIRFKCRGEATIDDLITKIKNAK